MESELKARLLKEKLIENILQYGNEETVLRNMSFHKNRDFTTYGISTPLLYRIMRENKKELMSLPLYARLSFSQDLFSTANEELGHISVFTLTNSVGEMTVDNLSIIEEYPRLFRTWSITDDYGLRVVQPLLLKYEREMLSILNRWSLSENMWLRRLSMVAFVRKIGASGKYTKEFLDICNRIIQDEEDLVRKAIGWALKDNMRGNKERIIPYIQSLREQNVSSTIILYAIRDIKDKEERQSLLKDRMKT